MSLDLFIAGCFEAAEFLRFGVAVDHEDEDDEESDDRETLAIELLAPVVNVVAGKSSWLLVDSVALKWRMWSMSENGSTSSESCIVIIVEQRRR